MRIKLKCFLAVSAIILALAAGAENPVDAPLAEFLFDNNTFSNTGTIGGTAQAVSAGGKSAPVITASGQGVGGGRALDLSANTMGSTGGYVSLADNDALNGLQSLTVQCWFKKSASFATVNAGLVNKIFTSGTYRYGFSLQHASYSITSMHRDIGDDQGQYLGAATDVAAFNGNDQWIFVAMTWDATTSPRHLKTYIGTDSSAITLVNDVTSTTVDASAASAYNTMTLILGSNRDGTTAFSGQMDNVRIWGSKTNASGAISQDQLEFWRRHDAGTAQAAYTFTTIDGLKNQSCTGLANWTNARLTGYRNVGDGGEGWYRLFLTATTCTPDNVTVIQGKNVSGYWVRVPDSAVNSHAWEYPPALSGAVYFSWLDPDPTANTDCRNKLQLAFNAARTRGGASALGQLYVTPGNFKVASTQAIYVGTVSITGLSGHKLWNSLPDNYTWNSADYSVNTSYTASNVIDYTGSAVSWNSTSFTGGNLFMPWNGKTAMFASCLGVNSTTLRCQISNLVVDFGWGTTGTPGTVRNILRIDDTTRAEMCYYQGFNGSRRADFVGCTFKNAPGAFIEGGEDCSVKTSRLEEYGDHAYYFGGCSGMDVENNTIVGIRAKTGSITNGIPSADYVGLTQREALKFRGCLGITIRNNVADIPNAKFVHFESSYVATQMGPCGGTDAANPAIIDGNRVKCNAFFSYAVSRRTTSPTQDDGPFYIQNVEITNNSIRASSSLIYQGATWYGGLSNILFARNGIDTWNTAHTAQGWVTVMLESNPDVDYHTEGGSYPISGVKFLDNNVLGGVMFLLSGSVGKFYVAHNTFDASNCSYSSSSCLIAFAALSYLRFPTNEVGFLPPVLEGISICDNVMKNYYSYVTQRGTAVVKDWAAGTTFGYDEWTGYGESIPRKSKSLVYDAQSTATKLYVNNADRVTADGYPSADTTHWTLWSPEECPFYYKNNTIYNNASDGGPDFNMSAPLPVSFIYEDAGNTVRYLSSGLLNANATHLKNGAVPATLDDTQYDISTTGTAAMQPDQITNFPYGG